MRVANTSVVTAGGGAVVCNHCVVADSPLLRLRGLLGRTSLASGEGILLRPTGAIHTWFMRFPIDAVFLDRELRVMRVVSAIRPWRTAATRKAHAVLELPAGEAGRCRIDPGQQLVLAGGAAR
jgi:uncharacterized protein